MTKRLALLAVLLLTTGSGSLADGLDINLNGDSARVVYAWEAAGGRLGIGAGWLRQQDEGDVVHAELHRIGSAGGKNRAIDAGLGGRIFFVDADRGRDGTVLGLGGFARLHLPSYPRLSIGGHLYFGPDVVSGGDLEEFREGGLSVGWELLEGADLYLGYRYVEAEFEGVPDVTLDDDLHVGLRLRF